METVLDPLLARAYAAAATFVNPRTVQDVVAFLYHGYYKIYSVSRAELLETRDTRNLFASILKC